MNYSEMVRTYTANDINTATGNAALPWVGTTFGDVYQFLMSAGDTAFGVGLFGPAVYSVLMGMGAAASTAKDLWERGASTEQMAVGGVLAGAAEYFFEKFSIDKLIHMKDADTIGDVFLNTLKQGGIMVVSASILAGVLSILTSVAGLPELKEEK